MLAGCIALPILLLLFAGKGGWWSGNWLLFGLVALCVGSHIAMMFGGRGGHSSSADGAEEKTNDANASSEKDKHTRGGGCH